MNIRLGIAVMFGLSLSQGLIAQTATGLKHILKGTNTTILEQIESQFKARKALEMKELKILATKNNWHHSIRSH